MKKKIRLAVIGTGNRYYFGYAPYVKKNVDRVELVAIADLNENTRNMIGDFHDLKNEQQFDDWHPMLNYIKDKNVDGVIVATSDKSHYAPAMACLNQNYNIILEKPMTPSAQECIDIVKLAQEKNKIVMVSHVLRYTPFFKKVKNIIDNDEIGTIQSIVHNENIFSFHMAHSFVRGNWGSSKTSSPIILAKSCHDLDILLYIMGTKRECLHVSAFGDLGHFKSENAPEGATERCTSLCPKYKTCPYSVDIYYNGCFAKSVSKDTSNEALTAALENSEYGRCVYHCDNDVCDHMTTMMAFDNGSTAMFSLSAFTDNMDRTIKIMGSHGEIRGSVDLDLLDVYHFGMGTNRCRNAQVTKYNPLSEFTKGIGGMDGHGGGDEIFLEDFLNSINGEGQALTLASESVKSHLMAFALEEARINKKVVDMREFRSRFK